MAATDRLRQPAGTAGGRGGQFAQDANGQIAAPVTLGVTEPAKASSKRPTRYDYERVEYVDPYPGVPDNEVVGEGLCARCGGTGRVTSPLDGGRCWGCKGRNLSPRMPLIAAEARRKEKLRVERTNRRRREDAKAELRREATVAELVERDPIWGRLDELRNSEHSSSLLQDLSLSLHRNGELSEKQVALGTRLLHEAVEREHAAGERAAAEAEDKARLALLPPLEEGRRELALTFLGEKEQHSDWGTTYKMLAEDSEGRKVWGTIPRGLDDLKPGDKVTLTATVTRSDDDPHFGFFARPTKATVRPAESTEDSEDEAA